jgi:hypothetical protein
MKKLIFILVLILSISSCELLYLDEDWFYEETEDINSTNVKPIRKLDSLFTNGFKIQLEQVYVMSGKEMVPFYDKPVDSCFFGEDNMITIDTYYSLDTARSVVLNCLSKDEIWNVSKMITVNDTTYESYGFGQNYHSGMVINSSTINEINVTNQYTRRNFIVNYKIGNPYNHRGVDNHVLSIYNYSYVENQYKNTVLYLSILTNDDGSAFWGDNKHLYLDTNSQYIISYEITAPLTSNEVKLEIERGNYTIYLWNGLTTYKIGNNLYIPRYNSYIYVGNTNSSGNIFNLKQIYMRLKFKIVK